MLKKKNKELLLKKPITTYINPKGNHNYSMININFMNGGIYINPNRTKAQEGNFSIACFFPPGFFFNIFFKNNSILIFF
jgi:hypothetical protein